ncbi:hypothetical protein NDU88_002178 [Pleurodeles waltl]|uniref:Uncharacterized protein n=1 Tax=Pleurodeles waltl TaxID=8319 RepID=A0AAV7UZ28_PLEWA|nr:hypothetical protein NDU88_002178 [Pleurodeles waltl]
MQLALAKQCDVKETISDMVWAFRTTPHSVTQRIPFVDMRDRLRGTKLVPAWLKGILYDETAVSDSVKFPKKDKMQASLHVEMGDWVKVCSGMMFMNDGEVVSKKGGMSLDDYVEEQGVGNECGDGSVECGDAAVLQKRIRRPPSYLEDFIR